MKVIIDRFEGDYAIVEIEVGKYAKLSKELVPNFNEGDVIKIEFDENETIKRKNRVKELIKNVFED